MPSRSFDTLGRLLSVQAIAAMIVVGAIPIVWPFMSQNEGRWLPVVQDVEVYEREVIQTDDRRIALSIDMYFNKVRQCDFVGLYWFDQFGARVPVVFLQDEGSEPVTRPVGSGQSAGPVLLVGLTELAGSNAVLESKCHFMWKTFTTFYP